MKYRRRIYYPAAQRDLMWDRWRRGDSMHEIGRLRGRHDGMAFIDLGDQFLALQTGRTQPRDDGRHVGLVVDNKEAARKALSDGGVATEPGPFLDFFDPWGNRIEIVGYDNIQFTKAANVLRGMGLTHLKKTDGAIAELTEKGMAPD